MKFKVGDIIQGSSLRPWKILDIGSNSYRIEVLHNGIIAGFLKSYIDKNFKKVNPSKLEKALK